MAQIFVRLPKEEKETIDKAVEIMKYNNNMNITMNDVVRSKMLTWAKRYLRNQ